MREEIQGSIDKLKLEIANIQGKHTDSKDKLSSLVEDLESELKNRRQDSFDDFIKPFRDSISAFETSHPEITDIINDIMTALSGIGI